MTQEEQDRRDAEWLRWTERLAMFEAIADPYARDLVRRAWNAAWVASREYDRRLTGPG